MITDIHFNLKELDLEKGQELTILLIYQGDRNQKPKILGKSSEKKSP